MYDKALALEILRQMQNAAQTVLKRFEPIGSQMILLLLILALKNSIQSVCNALPSAKV